MREKLVKSTDDKMINNPNHYQSNGGLEVIDVIEAFTSELQGIEATDTANIIKYACRWHKKNGIQDLEKILWYTQHLIDHLKSSKEDEKDVDKFFEYCDGLLSGSYCKNVNKKLNDEILKAFEKRIKDSLEKHDKEIKHKIIQTHFGDDVFKKSIYVIDELI